MDLAALKTEIAKPAYAGKNDEEIAAMLGVRDQQIDRESVTGGEILSCVTRANHDALNAADKEYLRLVMGCATAIPISAVLRTQLGTLFPAGSPTRTALAAMLRRLGTLAESLNLGGVVTPSHVADARRLP